MKRLSLIVSLLLIVLGICFYFLLKNDAQDDDALGVLEVHCAAGLRKPVQEIALQYEAEYGVKIRLNYGGSGQLYGNLSLRGGDLYLPADSSYIEHAQKEGFVSDALPLSYLTAGIVVQKGNPKGINVLADLARKDVSVAIAVRSAAVGNYTHEVLESVNLLDKIEAGNVSKFPTVNEIGTQVKLGAVDAGIIWDALILQYEDLEFIHVPEFSVETKVAMVGLLVNSKQPEASLQFARYLAASDRGGQVFKKHGFSVKGGSGNSSSGNSSSGNSSSGNSSFGNSQ